MDSFVRQSSLMEQRQSFEMKYYRWVDSIKERFLPFVLRTTILVSKITAVLMCRNLWDFFKNRV